MATFNLDLIRDPSYPFSADITPLGLLSTEENGVIFARQKYNKPRKSFKLHWNALSELEFEILSHFYHDECAYGTACFYWRYPILPDDVSDVDIGRMYQGKIFYVRTTKFSFKAVDYNMYRGDIVLTEV